MLEAARFEGAVSALFHQDGNSNNSNYQPTFFASIVLML